MAATPDDRLLSIQFSWGSEEKDVSTMFVGTSPEAELALYTLLFCAGGEETCVRLLGQYDVRVRCYRIRSKYGDKVGSAFPELLAKGDTSGLRPVGAAQ